MHKVCVNMNSFITHYYDEFKEQVKRTREQMVSAIYSRVFTILISIFKDEYTQGQPQQIPQDRDGPLILYYTRFATELQE